MSTKLPPGPVYRTIIGAVCFGTAGVATIATAAPGDYWSLSLGALGLAGCVLLLWDLWNQRKRSL